MKHFDLREAFIRSPERAAQLSQSAPHVFADLSKNYLDSTREAQLIAHAQTLGLEARRDAMFRGEAINDTEGRAVGHVRLRDVDVQGRARDSVVRSVLDAFLAYAEHIRANPAITDIVNIGIGGSDLGAVMATLALDQFVDHSKRYHFVSNVDGHELSRVLRQLHPASTLFIVASKTFTTLETMTNAQSARSWFLRNGGTDIAGHFCAVTTNTGRAADFGIETVFAMWDWVGGRYSIWSAVGLPLAIAIGETNFRAFLRGAHEMDQHFVQAPLAQNLPVRLGLLDHLYRNTYGFGSRCVAPYAAALGRLPAYLQQLEMESNGKCVDRQGVPLSVHTSAVVWGEAGTNGQHAFFQMLHQGTQITPVEFVAVRAPTYTSIHLGEERQREHHQQLLANAVAQAQALMQGRAQGGDGHRHFAGNRPSTFLLLDALSPTSLGALIALYEHRVFVCGVLWGINSFDQFGVELGKVLAQDIVARLDSQESAGLDSSTAALLGRCAP